MKRDYSNLPEHLPVGKLAFNDSTNELFIGAGEDSPPQKVTDMDIHDELNQASIDYSGEHHENLKDSMDANVDFIMGEFNSTQMTGEFITAQNTLPRHIKRAELRGHTEVNLIQEPSGQDLVLPYEFEDTQSLTLEDTKESGAVNIVLKGNTEVNVLKNPMRDYVVPYEFEEGYTATLTDTKETGSIKSAILKGATTKKYIDNLFDGEVESGVYAIDTGLKIPFEGRKRSVNKIKIEPSTTYTLSGITWYLQYDENENFLSSHEINNQRKTFTSKANAHYIAFYTIYSEADFFIGLGDVEPKHELVSVKMPVLTTNGKNLLDSSFTISKGKELHSDGTIKSAGGWAVEDFMPVTFRGDCVFSSVATWLNIAFYTEDKTFISIKNAGNNNKVTFTVPENAKHFRVSSGSGGVSIASDLHYQIEQGAVSTTYEPFKSNILSTPEDLVLRKVGDVEDTLDLVTGELTEHIQKITIDGVTVKFSNGNNSTEMQTVMGRILLSNLGLSNAKTTYVSIVNNRMTNPLKALWQNDVEGLTVADVKYIDIRIDKSKLSEPNLNGLNEYVKTNPIVVCYQKATPTVKTVDLTVQDQDGLSVPALSTYNEVTYLSASSQDGSLRPLITSKIPEFPVMIKPSTKYSIVADTSENGHTNVPLTYHLGGAEVETEVGNKVTVITTPSTLTNETFKVTGTGMKLSNVMILEKDLTGKEIPNYTEGMQSVQMPVLTTTGKNLFDGIMTRGQLLNNNVIQSNQTKMGYSEFLPINEDLNIYCSYYTNSSYIIEKIYFYDENKTQIGTALRPKEVTSPKMTKYFRLSITTTDWDSEVVFDDIKDDFNIQVEIGTQATSYEPFKSNILSCNEEVTLRGIGDVKDELDLMTGEVVQSVGVLNGEETGWQQEFASQQPTDSSLIAFSIDLISSPNKIILSPVLVKSSDVNKPYRWYISFGSWLVITLPKSEVTNLNEFKAWLKNNEVLYPLTEKSIKTVDLNIINQNGQKVDKLSTFNGVTYVESSVAENSLKPIISHKDLEYEVLLKPNTKYSIITNPISNGHTNSPISFDLGGQQVETTVGSYCTLVTTPNSLTHNKLVMKGKGNQLTDGVMVFEGDKTGMSFNHFDGMKSVENPTVKVSNKNLNIGMYEINTTPEIANHKENSASFKIPLRSLPNRVCDTLDLITGEYTQKIGEFIFTGDLDYETKHLGEQEGYYSISLPYSIIPGMYAHIEHNNEAFYCDYPLSITRKINKEWICSFYITGTVAGRYICINIKADSKETALQYLRENPITLQYPLETPITTKLDLAWEDGKLFAYDGTTHFFVDVDGGHLQPVLDIDVPVNIVAELSRLRAEKEQLESYNGQLENQLSLLSLRNSDLQSNVQSLVAENSQLKLSTQDLQTRSNVLQLKNKELKQHQEKLQAENVELQERASQLTQATENLTEGLHTVDAVRESGDLELLSSDFDLDFRLMEIEFALDIATPMSLFKGVKTMARTPYEMAKTLILGGKYDRADMEYKLGRYLERKQLTQEQYDELMALIEATDLVG